MIRCYVLARLSLSDANKIIPFAPTKAQAVQGINGWRRLLRANGARVLAPGQQLLIKH